MVTQARKKGQEEMKEIKEIKETVAGILQELDTMEPEEIKSFCDEWINELCQLPTT